MITTVFWILFIAVCTGFYFATMDDWDGGILGVILGVTIASLVGLGYFTIVNIALDSTTSHNAVLEKREGYEDYRVVYKVDKWDPFHGRYTSESIMEFGGDRNKAEQHAEWINEMYKKHTSKFVEVTP